MANKQELKHFETVPRLLTSKAAGKILPQVGGVISDVKVVIRRAHGGVPKKILDACLSEIYYQSNQLYWEGELSDGLLKAYPAIASRIEN